VELRNPDPSANPYLTFAVMLGAGLKGIEEGLELPAEATNNVFEMTDAELKEADIGILPDSLGKAITLFEESEVMKEILGDHIHEFFVANKKAEWADYKTQVSPWELDNYLSIL
jgi:glutamine synthetase